MGKIAAVVPIRLGEILRKSWDVYRSCFGTVVVVCLLCDVSAAVVPDISGWRDQARSMSVVGAGALGGLYVVVRILLSALGDIMMIQLTERALRSKRPGISSLIASSMPHVVVGALTMVLVVLVIFVGIIFLIVPGIVMVVVFSLFMQAVVLRDQSGWKALTYSSALLHGNGWRIFLLIIIVFIPMIVVMMTIGLRGMEGIVGRALTNFVTGLMTYYLSVALTVVFLQLETHRAKAADAAEAAPVQG